MMSDSVLVYFIGGSQDLVKRAMTMHDVRHRVLRFRQLQPLSMQSLSDLDQNRAVSCSIVEEEYLLRQAGSDASGRPIFTAIYDRLYRS